MPPSTGFGSLSRGGTDEVELSPAFEQFGIRYFICSLPGHCRAGMKIRISTEGITTQPAPERECKCGTLKKGKLSCCAPGGSWFKQCGNPGDPKPHTWFQGIAACKGKPIQHARLELKCCLMLRLCHSSMCVCMSTETASTIPPKKLICPKCGVTNGGKVSCCAKGGEWYQQCGAKSEKQYTWGQGIESCKSKLTAGDWACPYK